MFRYQNIQLLLLAALFGCSEDPAITEYQSTLSRIIHIDARKANNRPFAGADSVFVQNYVSSFTFRDINPLLPDDKPIWKLKISGIHCRIISNTKTTETWSFIDFNNCNGRCPSYSLPLPPGQASIDIQHLGEREQVNIGNVFLKEKFLTMSLFITFQKNEIPTEMALEITLDVIAEIANE